MSLRPAAVLWDMDGTLVDTEPYWFEAEYALVAEFGDSWSDELAQNIIGFDLIDAAAYIREHGNVDLSAEEIVDRLLTMVTDRVRERIPWRPGARELLTELNEADIPCALVTMSWRRGVDPVLEALPAGTFFATVAGDEVPVGKGKPHPAPYLIAAQLCGVAPNECVAIEDSPTGVRSALTAQCAVLGVPNKTELSEQPGLTIVSSLRGIGVNDLSTLIEEQEVESQMGEPQPPGARPHLGSYGVVAIVGVVALVVGLVAALRSNDQPTLVASLPPGAIAIDVWAPYWTLDDTLPEADRRLPEIRELSPFWFGARGVANIVRDENSSEQLTDALMSRLDGGSTKMIPSIRDELPAGEMAEILADPITRGRHVEAIVKFASDLEADGIDLDYEQFAFADGSETWATTSPNWVAFVTELAAALHDDDRTLTVSIPPVFDVAATGGRGYWVYDHGAIAPHVDSIRVMAYDFSTATAGPIAPLDWVRQAVDGTSAAVPQEYHDKLVLGVPAYGTNWVVGTSGDCPAVAEGRTFVTARSVGDLAARRGGVPLFNPITAEWSFVYDLVVDDGATSCVQQREVHWVDGEGAASRIAIARHAEWGGVSLWALGYEDQDVWDTIVMASRQPLEPLP
jgi:HAD superfamily hydrolase (TIGR01509 family)